MTADRSTADAATPGLNGHGAPVLLTDALRRPPLPVLPDAPHIAFIVDGFPAVLGGGERAALRHAALLTAAGYRVSLITFFADPHCAPLLEAACPVYLLPLTGVFTPAALVAGWQLGRFLRRERVSIVETFFESANLFGGFMTRALSGARLIWNRRDMGILRDRRHRAVYPWLRRLPHRVFAVSKQVREHAIAVDRIARPRTSVVYNSLALDHWQAVAPAPATARELRVVCLGNLRRVKGQDVLVEAVGLLAGSVPGVRVEFAGAVLEPEFAEALRTRIAALGIEDSIRFLGNVTDLPQLLDGAAACVLPSRSEGFSNALIEAMAAGLPVVATDVGGNREAVDDGVTGYIVPPEDAGELAAALGRLLLDPALRLAMGEAGRRRTAQYFADSAILRQLDAVYRALAARP